MMFFFPKVTANDRCYFIPCTVYNMYIRIQRDSVYTMLYLLQLDIQYVHILLQFLLYVDTCFGNVNLCLLMTIELL